MQERRYALLEGGIGVPMMTSGRVRSIGDRAGRLIHIAHEQGNAFIPFSADRGRYPGRSSGWEYLPDIAPACPRCIQKAGEPLKAEEI
jgi:hypothetical protein